MADDRVVRAWRAWVTERTPEAAQAYCVETSRADLTPARSTPLEDVDWGDDSDGRVRVAVHKAAETYLGTVEGAFLESLSWLTDSHFFVLGDIGPSVLRGIAEIYKAHGMELKPGDEAEAEGDVERMREGNAGLTRQLRTKIRSLESKLSDAQDERYEIDSLKRQAESAKSRAARYQSEAAKLEPYKKKAFDYDGLSSINAKLKQENERLAKIIQDMNTGGDK